MEELLIRSKIDMLEALLIYFNKSEFTKEVIIEVINKRIFLLKKQLENL